jgi:voltage-gated potassium channel
MSDMHTIDSGDPAASAPAAAMGISVGPGRIESPSGPAGPTPLSRYRRSRYYIYSLLHSPEIDSRVEFYLRSGIAALILINVVAIILETVQEINAVMYGFFLGLEYFSVVIFSFEYLLRLWSAVEIEKYSHPVFGRLRYIFSFFALVDVLAIAPFFLPAVISLDLRFIRGLRLLRLLRVMKLGRYSTSLSLLMKVCRTKRDDIFVSLFVIILILLISSSLMYFIEHEAQPKSFPNIPASLWWGVATLTTVGYGDIYPVTAIGKICAAIIALLGIGLVALPSGLLVAGFVDELQSQKEPKACPHCGKPL